jgi:N-acetylneuraminic acid mutarotase
VSRLAAALVLGAAAVAAALGPSRWEERAPLGVPRQETGVAALGGLVYAVGGFDADGPSATVEAYDPVADRWLTVAPLPRPLHHVGAAAVGDTLYAVGGLATDAFTAVADVTAFDPGLNEWRPVASLPQPRGAVGLATLGGRIYVAGGLRGGASIADFAAYDPLTDVWTELPAMPTARDHLAAAAIGATFYAVGGRNSGRLYGALEAYDPATGAWRADLPPLLTPRGGLMAAAVDTRLFAFGGEGNGADPLGIFPEVESYDVLTGRWLRLPAMKTPRHGTAAATLGGVIHVPGGAMRQGFGISAAHEVFVPPTGDVLERPRLRLRAAAGATARLDLRGRFARPPVDPAVAALTIRLLDGDAALVEATLPAGRLVANRRRTRFRYRTSTAAGFTRVVLVRARRDTLRVRLRAVVTVTSLPETVTVALALGDDLFCGDARVRSRRR